MVHLTIKQKRLGSGLRRYKKDAKGRKLADGKSVGGKGRLRDKCIDKMQNYYGKAMKLEGHPVEHKSNSAPYDKR